MRCFELNTPCPALGLGTGVGVGSDDDIVALSMRFTLDTGIPVSEDNGKCVYKKMGICRLS